ncbi:MULTISPECIES: LLM class flavin-dependent oxidoreductase [unclassified Mycolicibacterium]|uniref:LLM class flavin-dependent oxidoreductase n=1 Tax=unclassified Mycolicibacterium TaxID=2636767 RepID=UPI002ED9F7DD
MQFAMYLSMLYADPKLFENNAGWPASPSKYDPAVGEYSVDVLLEQAQMAEDLGFDMVSVSEHHSWPINQASNPAVLAAAISQRVKKLRIALMGPLAAINNPVRIAEEVAMLDAISKGRISLMPLRGTPNEFVSYGINPDETRDRTREAQALIARALSEPEPFSWEGRYFRFPTVAVWPGPSQQPIPIWSSGNSEGSVVYAARNKYRLGISYYPLSMAAELTKLYRAEAKKAGWQPTPHDILYRSYVACAETDETARDLEKRYYGNLGLAASMMGRASAAMHTMELTKITAENAAAAEIGTDADGKNMSKDAESKFALGDLHFKGSPATMVEQFTEWYDTAGIGVFDVGFSGGGLTIEETNSALKLFASEVIPAVKHLGAGHVMEEVR